MARKAETPLTPDGLVNWADIRDEHIERIGSEEFAAGKTALLERVRAARLQELRRGRGLTQKQVAELMGITVGRVSQIESGQVSGIDVVDRYVRALGGVAEVTAVFDGMRVRIC
jgi:DNA-binding transcriptional regulator YiaG